VTEGERFVFRTWFEDGALLDFDGRRLLCLQALFERVSLVTVDLECFRCSTFEEPSDTSPRRLDGRLEIGSEPDAAFTTSACSAFVAEDALPQIDVLPDTVAATRQAMFDAAGTCDLRALDALTDHDPNLLVISHLWLGQGWGPALVAWPELVSR
jgi:hypothetical protein